MPEGMGINGESSMSYVRNVKLLFINQSDEIANIRRKKKMSLCGKWENVVCGSIICNQPRVNMRV